MFRKLTKQEYRDLSKKVLFSTFFHNPEWFDFLEKEFKWLKFEYYLYKPARRSPRLAEATGEAQVGEGGDELLLSFGRVGDKLISLPFCEYGGPLPLKSGVDFEEFKKDVLAEFGNNIKIKFHPRVLDYFDISNKRSGRASEAVEHQTLTYWIESLKNISEQELWESLRKTLRHEIKNAQEHRLEIKKCKNLKELKKFYKLYVANLKHKKTIPYPWPLIQFLYQNSSSELLLALYKRKVIGGELFLRYNKFVHYFLSASDYKYRDFSVSHLLLWEKIKSLVGKDIIFDLGASPRGSALEVFKRGWGGKEYPIYQIGIKRKDEHLRSSKLRNIWGLLPNFVIKRLSSRLVRYRL